MKQAIETVGKRINVIVRAENDVDASGNKHVLVLVYDGPNAGEIWLKPNQRLVECMSELGFNRDQVPDIEDAENWPLHGRIEESAFEKTKAQYCSHPNVVQASEKSFAAIIERLRKNAGARNATADVASQISLKELKSYIRITGPGATCHGRLEQPKEGAERSIKFDFDPYVRIDIEKNIWLAPTKIQNEQMIWVRNESSASATEIADLIITNVKGVG